MTQAPNKPLLERAAGAQRQLDDARRLLNALGNTLDALARSPEWTAAELDAIDAAHAAVRRSITRLRACPTWLPRLPLGVTTPEPPAS